MGAVENQRDQFRHDRNECENATNHRVAAKQNPPLRQSPFDMVWGGRGRRAGWQDRQVTALAASSRTSGGCAAVVRRPVVAGEIGAAIAQSPDSPGHGRSSSAPCRCCSAGSCARRGVEDNLPDVWVSTPTVPSAAPPTIRHPPRPADKAPLARRPVRRPWSGTNPPPAPVPRPRRRRRAARGCQHALERGHQHAAGQPDDQQRQQLDQ